MKKLQHKLLRDLANSKGLFLAVTAVIFLGVALFGASFMGFQNLKGSYDYTYERLGFADFTVKVVEAPMEVIDDLESVPGVSSVVGRVNTDLVLTLPGDEAKSVLARVISLPSASRASVNDVKVETGRYFQPGETDTLLVEKSFAEHHGLKPGDTLSLGIDDQRIDVRIAGIVTSPEYIWPAKSRQEILVSPETFGVVFASQEGVSALIGHPTVNEFCFRVDEGADRDAVVTEVGQTLSPYGATDVVTLEEQPSNAALKMDLQELGEMAEVFPLLFLIVGALATYILLTRIVHNQRAQIGLMRAVGYSRRQVMVHYLSFAMIIGIAGSVLGTIAGYLLAELVTEAYVGILGLPFTKIETQWMAIEQGMLMGLLPCVIAGVLPAYSASRLGPAEAMRPPRPSGGRRLFVERLVPPIARLSSLWKIPLRNVFRNRRRSLYTIIGVAFGVSLILVSAAMLDSIEAMFDLHFNRIQRYDAQITFAEPQPLGVAEEVQAWEEVDSAEPVLQVPTRLEHDGTAYSTLTVGLPADSQLYGLYSPAGERTTLDENGVLLSEGLRKTLDVDVDDVVTLRTFSVSEVTVAGFVKQPMGSFAYVSLDRAQELSESRGMISGLMLKVASENLDGVRERAYQLPGTASVELTPETRQQIDELMGFISVMMWVMLGFGAALSLAIVFTTVTVNILERRREIATMRTLGEGKVRIGAMITIENLLLGLAGLLPGILLGYALSVYMFSLFQSDMMTFDLVIYARTYVLTAALVIVIMLLSQVAGIRQLNRLDLARVIKEQAT